MGHDASHALIAFSPMVSAWLEPLAGDEVRGPDLEYDNDFWALRLAASGKPGTQFKNFVTIHQRAPNPVAVRQAPRGRLGVVL
jgi:hypothetical protein